jgi:uncharacterized protein (TIRG00374 family)
MDHSTSSPRDETGSKFTILRWIIGLGITAVTLWVLATQLAWQDIWRAVGDADYGWVIIAAVAIVSTFFSRAWRWQALLRHRDVHLLGRITAILMGQIVNQALPLIRSGELVRAYWLRRYEEGIVIEALGSIALEKAWDLLAVSLCSLTLVLWMPLPEWFRQSVWGSLFTVTLIIVLLGLGLHWQSTLLKWAEALLERLPQGWRRAWMPRIRRLVSALNVVRRPRASMDAGLWTVMTWGLGAFANWAVLAAFGEASIPASLLLLVALMLGSAVVPTPGRLGVFEGICVVVLRLFDVPADRALAIGLVLHVVVLAPPFIAGALLSLWDVLRHMRRGQGTLVMFGDRKPDA